MKLFPLPVVLGLVVSLFATSAYAAEIHVDSPLDIGVGDAFTSMVELDTHGETINAIEGNLIFSKNLELKEIRDGNSIINLWIERPYDLEGTIRFSGITPGGFSGASGELFTLVFSAARAGAAPFSLTHPRVLLSDGQGTQTSLSLKTAHLSIAHVGSGRMVSDLSLSDKTPPEPFTISLASDNGLADGASFVTFVTQDKSSGIDHFEVAESSSVLGIFGMGLSWTDAASPYVLRDQTQHSYIYVRAIDHAGNARAEMLSPAHVSFSHIVVLILGILTLFGIFFCVRKVL